VSTFASQPGTTASIPITQGSLGSNWTVTSITSSNQTLLPDSGLTVNSGKTAIQAVVQPNQTGTATITMTLTNPTTIGTVVSTVTLNVLPGLSVSGASGGGTIRVVRNASDPSLVDLYVNNTSTTPTAEYNYADYSVMNISGLNSSDSLVVDYTSGDPVTAGGISFTGGAGADSISFMGIPSGNTVKLGSSSVQVLSGSNVDTVNFTGAETLNLDQGAGSNTLISPSGSTNFTGINITVDSGSTLTLGADTTLPTLTTLNLAGGSIFNMSNENESIDQLMGSGTFNTGNGNPVVGTLTIGARGGSSTFGGSITGSGGLTKVGAGMFTLSGSNTFTGAINIGTGSTTGGNVSGILRITQASAVNKSTLISLNDNNSAWGLFQIDGTNGNISLPSSLLFTLSANTNSNNVLENIAGNNTIAGAITFTVGGAGYGIQSDAGSLSFTGAQAITHVIVLRGAGNGSFGGSLNSSGSLNQSGTGVWTLSASNSYTGSTTVTSGQLTLGNNNALGATSGVSVSSGATLGLQGGITVPSGKTFTLNGSGVGGAGALLNVSGTNVWTSSLALSGTGGTIGVSTGQLTLSAGLSGGSLTKAGNGVLILNGANSYTTTTNVTGGNVELASGSLAATVLNVSSGATFTLDSATTMPATTVLSDSGNVTLKNASQTISTLNGTGVLNLVSTAVTVSGGGTFSGSILGNGSVVVSGGTLNLTGSNSFSGGTTVSGGQLNVSNSDALASGGLTISGSGLAALAAGLSNAIKLSSLSISGTGALDIANDAMVIEGTESTIEGLVQTGFAGGAWNGAGIRSSALVAGTTHAIGVAAATDLTATFPFTFVNQQADANSVLLRYTLMGDGNLSGSIDINDFNLLAANFGSAAMRWATGDFNFDGVVNLLDLNAIATNFGVPLSSPLPTMAPLSLAAPAVASLFADQPIRDNGLAGDVL
jgi:autotransporter-associated beta strand protein